MKGLLKLSKNATTALIFYPIKDQPARKLSKDFENSVRMLKQLYSLIQYSVEPERKSKDF